MNIIEQHIIRQYCRWSKRFWKEVLCKHKFIKYGLGYSCEKCSFYSGTNSRLNKYIAKLLAPKE